jgi:hypothetical protein
MKNAQIARRPDRRLLNALLAVVIAQLLTSAEAQVTHRISSFTRTDTGYIIASDANNSNPGWDRDGMHLRTVVQSSNPSPNSLTTAYSLVYRVLNSQNQPHPTCACSVMAMRSCRSARCR